MTALVVGLLVAAPAGPVAAAEAPAGAAPDPFVPAVTRREADTLNTLQTLAETDPDQAITRLETSDRAAGSAVLDYFLGNLYVQTERYPEAEAAYRDALRKWPRYRAALNNLARVCLLQAQPARATEALTALVRDGQGDADTLLLLGHALALDEQPISAEGAYRQALLLRPGDADARQGLARTLLAQQRYAECEALLAELLVADPQRGDWWALRAGVQLARDRTDAALAGLETARRLGVIDPDGLDTLGQLYLARGQPAEAHQAFAAALAAAPGAPGRTLNAVSALLGLDETGPAEALLTALETASAATGAPPWSVADQRTQRRLRADLARQRDDLPAAREGYRALLREDPLDGESLLALGELEARDGRVEEAVMTFERAARLAGFELRALERQAQAEVSRARYAAAVRLLERAQAFEDRPHVARYLDQVRRLANAAEGRAIY